MILGNKAAWVAHVCVVALLAGLLTETWHELRATTTECRRSLEDSSPPEQQEVSDAWLDAKLQELRAEVADLLDEKLGALRLDIEDLRAKSAKEIGRGRHQRRTQTRTCLLYTSPSPRDS